jgi:hypothetical protein
MVQKTDKNYPETKIRYTFKKILTGSDLSRRRLPFMAAESSRPGPVVWLTACSHGDEVGDMVVIQEIFKLIRKHGILRYAPGGKTLSGTKPFIQCKALCLGKRHPEISCKTRRHSKP